MGAGGLDQQLTIALNSYAAGYHDIWRVSSNALIRGFPISFALISFWFADDCTKRRSRMLVGLLAVSVATLFSVWSQFHLNVHTRPFLDPTLHLTVAAPEWTLGWSRTNSFPSDSATLFFGLSMVIFVEKWIVGVLCFLWTIMIVAIPRVVFGFHYPSDILGAAILGPGSVVVFDRIPYLGTLLERLLMPKGYLRYVNALLFIFLADALDLFQGAQDAAKFFGRLVHGA
jgi:membrane-associated phospholipid phosphatase